MSSFEDERRNHFSGRDGFTGEFYLRFWDGLGQVMVNSFNYAFTTGNLSISQRQGIIRVIPKKENDPF